MLSGQVAPLVMWSLKTTDSEQVSSYLVNILRKVWMICSVKGTPIWTLRPRNRVRKKLSISSVTSTFGGRRKAVRARFALQGGTGDFP